MKKVISLAAVIGLTLLVSCKKSGTCTCKDENSKVVSIAKYEDSKQHKVKRDCQGTTYGDKMVDGEVILDEESKVTCDWEKTK